MSIALVLILTGLLIVIGGFIFAFFNMILSMPDGRSGLVRSNNVFSKHFGAMIAVACGSIMFVTGIFVAVVELITRILP